MDIERSVNATITPDGIPIKVCQTVCITDYFGSKKYVTITGIKENLSGYLDKPKQLITNRAMRRNNK